jgi:hypothetical protein
MRCAPAEDLPRSTVEAILDGAQHLRSMGGEAGALGEELAQQPVRVLVRPA